MTKISKPTKTTRQEYEQFCAEFSKWVDRLDLREYSLLLQHADLGGSTNSDISVDHDDMFATCRYNKRRVSEETPETCALHEALHLLLGRFAGTAIDRFSSERELNREEESIVNRLEKLLGGG